MLWVGRKCAPEQLIYLVDVVLVVMELERTAFVWDIDTNNIVVIGSSTSL